jgi:hypothetical protein
MAGFLGDKSNSMKVEGIEPVMDAIRRLPNIVTGKHLYKAMGNALKPMENELRALTPQGPTGSLYKAVGSRVRKYGGAAGGVVFGVVGYKRAVSKQTGDNKGFHSHWIEFGTEDRTPKNSRILSSLALSENYTPPGWKFAWPMVTRKARGLRGYHPLGRAFSTTSKECADKLAAELELALDRAIDEARVRGFE